MGCCLAYWSNPLDSRTHVGSRLHIMTSINGDERLFHGPSSSSSMLEFLRSFVGAQHSRAIGGEMRVHVVGTAHLCPIYSFHCQNSVIRPPAVLLVLRHEGFPSSCGWLTEPIIKHLPGACISSGWQPVTPEAREHKCDLSTPTREREGIYRFAWEFRFPRHSIRGNDWRREPVCV